MYRGKKDRGKGRVVDEKIEGRDRRVNDRGDGKVEEKNIREV